MNLTTFNIAAKNTSRKLGVTILVVTIAVFAFGALGDGNKAPIVPKKSATLLSGKTYYQGSFSLRSGYNYRGNQVLSNQSNKQYINLNTVVTLQRGNTTYIVPLKKKVILDKVKIELGNRQFQRN